MSISDYIKMFNIIRDNSEVDFFVDEMHTTIFGQPVIVASSGTKYGYDHGVVIRLDPDGAKTYLYAK